MKKVFNIYYNFLIIELCCAYCYFMNLHKDHKILRIEDEESLKKENITINNSTKEFDNNIQKLNKLKKLIEEEMIKIDEAYEKVDKETTEFYQIKMDKLKKEEEDLKEKLKTEVTKIKEKLEIHLSEINNISKICDKLLKGIKNMANEEKNMNKILSYVSKINKNQKEMKLLFKQFMKNIKISFIKEESKIKYDEYYFNGIPIPQNIEFKDIGNNTIKIYWDINNSKMLNINKNEIKFIIEMRKENKEVKQIIIENNNNYTVDNSDNNNNYELRICSIYNNIMSDWSKLYRISSKLIDSLIINESGNSNEYLNKLSEWTGFQKFELLYRGTRDGSEIKKFHEKCDNKGPTICLIKNDKGNIFGGYTPISWTTPQNPWIYKSSNESFLFTLSNIYNIGPTKFPNTDSNYSVCHYQKRGPTFGGGHNLSILENYLNNNNSYSDLGHSYQDVTKKGRPIFTGDANNINNNKINIKELEIFKLYN